MLKDINLKIRGFRLESTDFFYNFDFVMNTKKYLYILIFLLFGILSAIAEDRDDSDIKILRRIWSYRSSIDTSLIKADTTYSYNRFYIRTQRRNILLLAIPSMYEVAHGKRREFMFENYNRVIFNDLDNYKQQTQVFLNTIPHRRHTMSTLSQYMTPKIYDVYMFANERLLSPFNRGNRQYYRYYVGHMVGNVIDIEFRPKTHNTQLVSGHCIVHPETGRVEFVEFDAEFDMINFHLSLTMSSEDMKSILPTQCRLNGSFKLLGNRVSCSLYTSYGLKKTLPDSINNVESTELMNIVRPFPLTHAQTIVYDKYYSRELAKMWKKKHGNSPYIAPTPIASTNYTDTTHIDTIKFKTTHPSTHFSDSSYVSHPKSPLMVVGASGTIHESVDTVVTTTIVKTTTPFYHVVDDVADHLWNRIRGHFGSMKQGEIRLNPLFNPLYFGYNSRRGLTYKFKARGTYRFSENSDISLELKAGYSFKQQLIYYSIPATIFFNHRKNAYIRLQLANGNRINNSLVVDALKQEKRDSINWDKMNLDYFKDFYWRTYFNYDFSTRLGMQLGVICHKRSAVDKSGYNALGQSGRFKSVAPNAKLIYRPTGYSGPAIALCYERGIKGLIGANLEYERFESDIQYVYRMVGRKSWSFRTGGGFYTDRSKEWYFLDYENFYDENIIGGWNDKWTGSFELLNSHWYNSSKYYIRANAAYESPLLFLYWVPILGHYVERESLYASLLHVSKLKAYGEIGYSFKTRVMTLAAFMAFANKHVDGLGVKFAFELFRSW